MTLEELLALPPEKAASQLLGWELIWNTPEGSAGGIIVETELYLQEDPASHSFRGITPRTTPMFKEAGTLYTYLSYGIHTCLNLVVGPTDYGAAVLVRSLEPTIGIDVMKARRKTSVPDHKLASGPGNVGKSLGITLKDSGKHLNDDFVQLHPPHHPVPKAKTSERIGISQGVELLYRFYIPGNPSVSGKVTS